MTDASTISTAASARRFCVAGLEVEVKARRADDLDGLGAGYEHYPSAGGRPGLILDIERVPGFARDRVRGPAYPAFEAKPIGPGRVALARFDAEGELALPDRDDEPVRARFRMDESPNTLEAAVRIGMCVALPRRGGLILHASALAWADRAAIFAGHSGAGKSTIAAMLCAHRPALEKLSDELLVVAPSGPDGGWEAHVAPFLGSRGLPHGTRREVAGVHFLVQAGHHRRIRLARPEAVRELMRHILVYVTEPATAARVLAAAGGLMQAAPGYRLEFAKDPGVARVLGIT
ncbi:hypothetical protein [Haliangium sp.]|uniref:hypothetical protein n=1 Tax=Haliangium sp. TaxID=2663208 RepID=UPI003D0B2860